VGGWGWLRVFWLPVETGIGPADVGGLFDFRLRTIGWGVWGGGAAPWGESSTFVGVLCIGGGGCERSCPFPDALECVSKCVRMFPRRSRHYILHK